MLNFSGGKNDQLTAPFPVAGSLQTSNATPAQPPIEIAESVRSVWSILPKFDAPYGFDQAEGGSLDSGEQAGSRIIADAKNEAAAILRDAGAEAAELLAKANAEANVSRSGAAAEGYAEGLLRARGDVETDLTERFDRRVEDLRAEVNDTVRSIVEAREIMWQGVEGEIMKLSLEIARKVIKIEVQENRAVVGEVIKDALRRVADRDSVRIVVHPSLLDEVRADRADLLLALDTVQNLSIDSDQRVSPGGCLIETNAGCIDAKLETQLEQVELALRV